eukprot:scaffold5.g634.t1
MGAPRATRRPAASGAALAGGRGRAAPEPVPSVPDHWLRHLEQVPPGEARALRAYLPLLARINALGPAMAALSDERLQAEAGELITQCRHRAGSAYASSSGASAGAGWRPWGGRRGGSSGVWGVPGGAGGGEGDAEELDEKVVVRGFALVREAAWRVLGMRPYDVQMLGGLALLEGQVAEMATGEGKTLAAAAPAFVLALGGRGVHLVTVNDYLAARDADWIGKVLAFLGLSVGVVTGASETADRRAAFARDVTYVTGYQLAWTLLSDNLAAAPDDLVFRRPFHAAIVDEVARLLKPYKLSPKSAGLEEDDSQLQVGDPCGVARRGPAWRGVRWGPPADGREVRETWDFLLDQRLFSLRLTTRGMRTCVRELARREQAAIAMDASGASWLVLPDTTPLAGGQAAMVRAAVIPLHVRGSPGAAAGEAAQAPISTPSWAALLDQLDKRGLTPVAEAALSDAQLDAAAPPLLWDGPKASAMPAPSAAAWGRFMVTSATAVWLFERDKQYIALEAKENLPLRAEDANQASITYPSLFSYYPRLAGMTGTASTEQEELAEAYGLSILRVPPHRPSARVDRPLECYYFQQAGLLRLAAVEFRGKLRRLSKLVSNALQRRQPVLIGTSSVEESEELLAYFRRLAATARRKDEEGLAPAPTNLDDINLLNARPEAVRREAETVAQAGLPRTVTIATSLAGRGTDILLGGSPKGLVAQALANCLLPILARGAADLDAFLPPVPLASLSSAFCNEQAWQEHLPPVLADALLQGRHELECRLERDALLAARHGPGGTWVGERGAEAAAGWLAAVVEAAEVVRSHVLRDRAAGRLDGPLLLLQKLLGSPVAHRISKAEREWQQQQREQVEAALRQLTDRVLGASHALAAPLEPAQLSLLPLAVLLWAWFDQECHKYGEQGDPGETFLLASMDDPAYVAWLGTAAVKKCKESIKWNFHYLKTVPDEDLELAWEELEAVLDARQPPPTAAQLRDAAPQQREWTIGWEVFKSEVLLDVEGAQGVQVDAYALAASVLPYTSHFNTLGRAARESTRRYGEVVQRYRMHAYTLRRQLLCGGAATRGALVEAYLQEAAEQLVDRLVETRRPPAHWNLLPLLHQARGAAVQRVVNYESQAAEARRLADEAQRAQREGAALKAQLSAAEAALEAGRAPRAWLARQVSAAEEVLLAKQRQLQDDWDVYRVGDAVRVRLNLRPEDTSVSLYTALVGGGPLPPPAAAAAAGGRGAAQQAAALPPPPLRSAAASAALRRRLAAAASGSRGGGEARAALVAWVAELLCGAYRVHQALLADWVAGADPSGGVSLAEGVGRVRALEREALLGLLDGLWGDFLQASAAASGAVGDHDVDVLEKTASFRTFRREGETGQRGEGGAQAVQRRRGAQRRQLDAVEEFQLEAGNLFAQLLTDFKQQAAVLAFAGYEIVPPPGDEGWPEQQQAGQAAQPGAGSGSQAPLGPPAGTNLDRQERAGQAVEREAQLARELEGEREHRASHARQAEERDAQLAAEVRELRQRLEESDGWGRAAAAEAAALGDCLRANEAALEAAERRAQAAEQRAQVLEKRERTGDR